MPPFISEICSINVSTPYIQATIITSNRANRIRFQDGAAWLNNENIWIPAGQVNGRPSIVIENAVKTTKCVLNSRKDGLKLNILIEDEIIRFQKNTFFIYFTNYRFSFWTYHWSQSAVITVSNAPKIDPNASKINIAKNNVAKRAEYGNLQTISG